MSPTLTLVTHHVLILNPFILALSPTILLLCWFFKSTLCNTCFLEVGKSFRACSSVIGVSLSKYFSFRFGSSSSHSSSYFFSSPFAPILSRMLIHSIQSCSECWNSSGLDTTACRRNQLWQFVRFYCRLYKVEGCCRYLLVMDRWIIGRIGRVYC